MGMSRTARRKAFLRNEEQKQREVEIEKLAIKQTSNKIPSFMDKVSAARTIEENRVLAEMETYGVKPEYPVPVLDTFDVSMGNIKHLPKWDNIPEEFKARFTEPHCKFIMAWFYEGLSEQNLQRLKEKPGVFRQHALRAIRAILSSWDPKHEHKIAGAAYLLSRWFVLEEKTDE